MPARGKKAAKKPSEAVQLAVQFHNIYEKLAPKYGYETRPETKKFKRATPNGKLMIAVAAEILAKLPEPKAPPVTDAMFENYFFKLSETKFVQLTADWNDEKLKIKLVRQKNYDAWLNYFKTMSPNQIKLLAKTGLDILPTEGYAALSRWHDIISNPGRIDKIHKAGLSSGKESKSIVDLAAKNDRYGVLKAIRDELAGKLQKGAGNRDTADLAKQLTEVMTQIADYERRLAPDKKTILGELLSDMPGSGIKPKRPAKNGGGARQGSFRSRVTIKDLEDS